MFWIGFWIGFDCNPFSNPGFSWRIGFGSEWIGLLPKFWIGFWIVPTFGLYLLRCTCVKPPEEGEDLHI